MNHKTKLALLDRIYRLYDDVIAVYDLACRKFCSDCCTRNVVLTTLEAYKIVDHLISNDQLNLLKKLKKESSQPRFQPQTTTNSIARLCMEGRALPDEHIDPGWGACPLLQRKQCLLYSVRPFGCRCLVSRKKCSQTGCAQLDDFLLSVNTVFQQYIEHIDMKGRSGNLTDVLLWMEPEKNRQVYERDDLPESELVCNQPIQFLFVPPEHRDRMKPILDAFQSF